MSQLSLPLATAQDSRNAFHCADAQITQPLVGSPSSNTQRERVAEVTEVAPARLAPLPEAPPQEPETEPQPATPERKPDLDPFDPEWPDDRPEPQPKA